VRGVVRLVESFVSCQVWRFLLPAGPAAWAVMADRSDTEDMDTRDHVFDPVNIALTPIHVHFAAFLPAVSPRMVRHVEIVSIRRAGPSSTVGFRVVVRSFFHGCDVKTILSARLPSRLR
jgi:hypothetical protein